MLLGRLLLLLPSLTMSFSSVSNLPILLRHPPRTTQRGVFIVLEGVDRCGKTTQTALLAAALQPHAVMRRFPNRTTVTGTLIDQYLTSSQDLDDHAIHLLFGANRWEAADDICRHLAQGTSVVCDRYAYSGAAFSAAKVGPHGEPLLSLEWCQNCDVGLPAPDCVIFLDLSPNDAEQRGGYGNERYEQRDMQIRVRQQFDELHKRDTVSTWTFVNAAQSIDKVHADIWNAVEETIHKVEKNGRSSTLGKMWDNDGVIDLTQYEDEKENV